MYDVDPPPLSLLPSRFHCSCFVWVSTLSHCFWFHRFVLSWAPIGWLLRCCICTLFLWWVYPSSCAVVTLPASPPLSLWLRFPSFPARPLLVAPLGLSGPARLPEILLVPPSGYLVVSYDGPVAMPYGLECRCALLPFCTSSHGNKGFGPVWGSPSPPCCGCSPGAWRSCTEVFSFGWARPPSGNR